MVESDEILGLVKRDPDRYLASLYAPAEKRADLWLLYAFDAEIARIPQQVSEPQLGEIRLQWWRETLDHIAQGEAVASHPVALGLATIIPRYRLPVAALQRLLDARAADLYDDAFPDLTSLEAYFGETHSTIMQLGALILGHSAPELAGYGGVARGLSLSLSQPNQPPTRFIPADLLTKLGEKGARHELRQLAQQRLHTARELARQNAKNHELLPVFLPLSLVEHDLQQADDLSPTRTKSPFAPLKRQFTLWRNARRNRF